MRAFVVCAMALLCSQTVVAEISNCHVKSTNSKTVPIRQTLNSAPVGYIKSNTPVTISTYNTNYSGQFFAYVSWEGQPLKSVKNRALRNSGWVARESFFCD